MQREDQSCGQLLGQQRPGAFNFAHPGQKGQHIAGLLAPRGQHRAGHRRIQPQFGPRAQPAQFERISFARACHDRRISKQIGKPRPIDCRGHDQQPQIRAQDLLALNRQGQPQIAVEMPLVRLVKQHSRNPGQLGIT